MTMRFLMRIFFIFLLFAFTANASELIVTTFEGQAFDLKKQQNKIILVNFWASWCKDCLQEMPLLNELYQKYHTKGLEIIALNVEGERRRSRAQEIAEKNFYPSAMLRDAEIAGFDEIKSLPTSYIIDRKGVVSRIENDELQLKIAEFF